MLTNSLRATVFGAVVFIALAGGASAHRSPVDGEGKFDKKRKAK